MSTRYSRDHEWIRPEGDTVVVGIRQPRRLVLVSKLLLESTRCELELNAEQLILTRQGKLLARVPEGHYQLPLVPGLAD